MSIITDSENISYTGGYFCNCDDSSYSKDYKECFNTKCDGLQYWKCGYCELIIYALQNLIHFHLKHECRSIPLPQRSSIIEHEFTSSISENDESDSEDDVSHQVDDDSENDAQIADY